MTDTRETVETIFGRCCNCLRTAMLPNIVALGRRHPTPGKGWGCVICGLPADGAVAVLCNGCMGAAASPRFVCEGYAAEPGRVAFLDLAPDPFEHDMQAHAWEELDSLTDDERDLLEWLGACEGMTGYSDHADLNALVAIGAAQVVDGMVTLTERGHTLLAISRGEADGRPGTSQ
jgi:hypothetical protein